MTPNQRLLIAVGLSVLFFTIYTAIFPPVQQPLEGTDDTQKVELQKNSTQKSVTVDNAVGHTISEQDRMASTASSDIVTVINKDFILKIDTLGRISSKELLQKKYNDKDGNHAQLIPTFATKPLFVRFLDDSLNKEAITVPYTANTKNVLLNGSAVQVILTQKLSKLTVTKELTFYPDGHYDAVISLSDNKRYFVYLGQRPEVTKKMMTVVGAMVYTDDDIATIIADGDAEGRKMFTGVELISAFDQYSATIMYNLSSDTNVMVEHDRDNNPIVYFDALQL